MKRVTILLAAGLIVAVLGACGQPQTDTAGRSQPQAPASAARSFQSAGQLILMLNHHGVTCRPAGHPGVGPELATTEPVACMLPDGERLTVVIAKDAARIYQKQFAGSHSPQRVLYGPNWLVILPKTVPAQTVQTIRSTFHARG